MSGRFPPLLPRNTRGRDVPIPRVQPGHARHVPMLLPGVGAKSFLAGQQLVEATRQRRGIPGSMPGLLSKKEIDC